MEATAIEEVTGTVNKQLEPCIFIEFASGKKLEFVIDTGFNGGLCLPVSLGNELGLKIISEVEIFGIGSHRDSLKMAVTEIIWFGRKTTIEILINDGDDRLLGSELLDSKILTIDYRKMNLIISNEQ